MTTAKDMHTAMTQLRKGKITPDEFRAIMRASREQHGQADHDRLKAVAVAATNR
jgi:hypothetical protein